MDKLNEGLTGKIKDTIPATMPDTVSKPAKVKTVKKPKVKEQKIQQLPIQDKIVLEKPKRGRKKKVVGEPSQKQLITNSNSTIDIFGKPIKNVQTFDELEMNQFLTDINIQQEEQAIQENKEQLIERANETIEKSAKIKEVVETETNQKVQEAEAKGQTITPQIRQQIRQQIVDETNIEKVTPADYEAVKDIIEEENNINLDNVNVPKLAAGIGEALDNIPDAEDISIVDIEVKTISKKTREGYYKTKVTIKKDGIPEIINKISSEIKKRTKGLISPRVCDLRVIGNTNKTQLRNSILKLSVNTVVFKPDAKRLKVNKGTRFMISIPEDFNSTGNLLVYIQESRDKTIIEINTNELADTVDFFASNISDYYYQGYDVTLKKLQRKGVGCPIMEVVNLIVANRGYKIKTYGDKQDNHIYQVDITSKDTEINEFISVRIKESNQPGLWDVIAFDNAKYWAHGEFSLNQEGKSIKYLMTNILSILNKVYDMDWTSYFVKQDYQSWKQDKNLVKKDYDEEYETKNITSTFEIKKLKHNKLIDAAYVIKEHMFYEERDEEDEKIYKYDTTLDLTFKCVSKQAMKKHSPENYDAEAIVGKTSTCSFVLTYLAYQIKGGDKRAGRDYITREQYYQKYNVADRRDYQHREKTILRRQNAQRNYNARPYLFQLEYKINGSDTTYKYISKSYQEIFNETGILTLNPVGINKEI